MINYYHGNDPAHWYTNVPAWGGVRYVDLYPGVDLEITGEGEHWAWWLRLKNPPPALPLPGGGSKGGDVRLRVEGADEVAVNDGHLRLTTTVGDLSLPLLTLRLSSPRLRSGQAGQAVEGATPASEPATVHVAEHGAFDVALPFASTPSNLQFAQDNPDALLFSTFLGGDDDDETSAMAVGSDGAIYVTGRTKTPTFPTTPGAYDSSLDGDMEVFVTKLNPTGSDLVYSTYLGGYEMDYGRGDIAVGQDETVYVAGYTASSDFPTTKGAYDTTFGGGECYGWPCDDVFVARLRVVPQYTISGRVLDGSGNPIEGVQILASAEYKYSATTDASGQYTITVPAGTYTLTPIPPGYFWSPDSRTVTVPPDASGQDFTGRSILKEGAPGPSHGLGYGESLTYTLHLIAPEGHTLVLYDPVPPHTTYISGSLSVPSGVVFDPATDAISGTLSLTATIPATVSFAVRVAVTGTAESAPLIVNRACVHPVGGGLADCEWSNEVLNFTYVWPVYLPLMMRGYAP